MALEYKIFKMMEMYRILLNNYYTHIIIEDINFVNKHTSAIVYKFDYFVL